MEQAIKTEAMFATIKPNLMLTLKNIETAPNEQLRNMHKKTLAAILGNARRIARMHYAAFVGEQRTIKGWWHPERFTPMKHASSEVIRGMLAS